MTLAQARWQIARDFMEVILLYLPAERYCLDFPITENGSGYYLWQKDFTYPFPLSYLAYILSLFRHINKSNGSRTRSFNTTDTKLIIHLLHKFISYLSKTNLMLASHIFFSAFRMNVCKRFRPPKFCMHFLTLVTNTFPINHNLCNRPITPKSDRSVIPTPDRQSCSCSVDRPLLHIHCTCSYPPNWRSSPRSYRAVVTTDPPNMR